MYNSLINMCIYVYVNYFNTHNLIIFKKKIWTFSFLVSALKTYFGRTLIVTQLPIQTSRYRTCFPLYIQHDCHGLTDEWNGTMSWVMYNHVKINTITTSKSHWNDLQLHVDFTPINCIFNFKFRNIFFDDPK